MAMKGNSSKNTKKGKMTVQEAGRKGGQATSREHGPEFYHTIGTMGGKKVKEYIEMGKKVAKEGKTKKK